MSDIIGPEPEPEAAPAAAAAPAEERKEAKGLPALERKAKKAAA